MKIRRFSTLEISLSAFLMVAVSVFLINQLVLMSRNNALVRQYAAAEKCASNLRDYLEFAVSSSDKVFSVATEGERMSLIGTDALSSQDNFAGIAVSVIGQESELKIFKREERFGHETYTYSVFRKPKNIENGTKLEGKDRIGSEQDLLGSNCKASQPKPFELSKFKKNGSQASMITMGIEDEIFHVQNRLVFSKLLWKGTNGI